MVAIDEEKFNDAILRLLLLESNIRDNWRPYVADRLKELRLQLKDSVGKKDAEEVPLTHELNYEWMWNELERWMKEQEQFGNNLQQALGFAYLGVMQKIENAAQQKRVSDACPECGEKKKLFDSAGYPVNCHVCNGTGKRMLRNP